MGTRSGVDTTRGRRCLAEGCGRRVRPGEAHCKRHGRTAEAAAFRRELRGAAAYLERADSVDASSGAAAGAARAAGALVRFDLRSRRGEFDRVHATRAGVAAAEAAAQAEIEERVRAAHVEMVRAVTEEPDLGRMTTAVVRGAREAARARGS